MVEKVGVGEGETGVFVELCSEAVINHALTGHRFSAYPTLKTTCMQSENLPGL